MISSGKRGARPDVDMANTTQSTEVLSGIVERVTFHNLESGFCVIRVKARGHKDLVTVVGHAAAQLAAVLPEREDLLVPDDLVRDERGRVIGYRALRTASSLYCFIIGAVTSASAARSTLWKRSFGPNVSAFITTKTTI
jgi:hypothetical protein